ncbi:LPS export ABC transporter periplasmic protein LptC [Candidatus Pelagibacter sp.]|nr:LPS export ABC transporter periplasmic protein LptC [Candidatus Pelagibacter sp.]
MIGKRIGKVFLISLGLITLFFLIYLNFFQKKKNVKLEPQETVKTTSSSNIINDVRYTTKDVDGNEYIITAFEGEIDYSDPNILYLTEVEALIILVDSENITINSDYGKYNSENFDTIFSKNVIINYLDNNITGKYLDFSLERNSMLISKKVVYTNLENILKADVIEVDIKTKDAKIFMYENQKKVNIKSID